METFPFETIISWYKKNGRKHLPWRKYEGFSKKKLGYRVWLSEIILQQTQAERGKEYFIRILKKYPKIEILANTSYENFFPDYKGLGYYSRAKNMLKTAKIVSKDYNGMFPQDETLLTQLPGIGPYTAEAMKAFAYNISTLSFDTNLLKIFSRYYYGDKKKEFSKGEEQELLKQFLKTGISGRDINNALMDFGSMISLNNKGGIDWKNYPLKDSKFYLTRGKLEQEKIKPTQKFPSKKAKIVVVLHENHKKYFSQSESNYEPFILEPNSLDPRRVIQKYFLDTFSLELSVRPPHTKDYHPNDASPYMVFNAQVQAGIHNFNVFSKKEKMTFTDYLI